MTKMKREKILILSGALGDGHIQAARAIVEASELYRPGTAVKTVEFMEWIHPRMHVIERYCFLHWVKHFPSLYGYLYQKTRADNSLSYFLKQFRTSSLNRLLMLIQDEQPTVLVSTFPPASAAISMLKSKEMTALPAVTVITDHSDHSYWIQPRTDLYLVGSEGVRIALRNKGVPDGNIAVTGIPVRPSYAHSWDRNRLRAKYGIASSSFVVLVMGGGCGMIDKSFIDQLKSELLPPNIQFILICGRNAKLQQRLHEALGDRENVKLEGYVEEIHEWMAVADVLITKPGGLTTSEALARQLPMLLFDPQLGQERDNADYLIRAGVAIPCRIGDLHSQLGQLARNPELLQRLKEKAGECGQQNSAAHALTHILNATHSAMESAWGTSVQQYA